MPNPSRKTAGRGQVARFGHQGASTEWFSSTRKFSVAAAKWMLAMNEIGVPAKCMAMGTPYSMAASPIFLVSIKPPEVVKSGWMISTA